jgi:hypothetical protein
VGAVETKPLRKASRLERSLRALQPKKFANRYGAKALEIGDIVLGSIPAAGRIKEIKDVAMTAIKK